MQNDTTQAIDENNLISNNTKHYLISHENYQLLRQYQKLISEVLEFSPSLRKIINELITVENLEKVKAKFLTHWSL